MDHRYRFPKKPSLAWSALAAGLLLALALVLASALPVRAQSGEEIKSFASDITVHSDGRITVVETITYYFPTARHGIYRDIPTAYVNDQGEKFYIPLDVKSVGNGKGGGWPYREEGSKYAVRIKIGDPDRTITGDQIYVITYEARGALRYFQDHDELYWNATGTEWTVPIRQSAASVHLPDNIPADQINLRCFTGPRGSTSESCMKNVQGRTAEFAANDTLTVVVGWPPDLVAEMLPKKPGWLETAGPALFFLLQLLVPLLVFIFLFIRWWRFGRDTKGSPTMVVQYDPPDGLTPAEVGTLYDEKAEIKDISATIVHLAIRGYLKIREVEKQGLIFKGKDHEFEKLKDYAHDQTLKPYEQKILSAIFGSGDRVRMSYLSEHHAFHGKLSDIRHGMYDHLVYEGYFDKNPERVRAAYIGVGMACIFIGFFVGVVIIAGLITGVLFLIFAGLMPRRTPKGVAAQDHVKGFREYLSRAEKYRLQWQEKENIFETFLPYAMAFGVVDKWSKAFEGMSLQPPQWYEGSAFHAGMFNAAAFNSAFSSLNSSMNSAVMSAPAKTSSGSGFSSGGGGGFSGGGGGGGGGGSW